MSGPTVSVIIAAYNAMPYVTRSVTSVAEQTIGRDALEVLAVNDGSTDGTAEELERLAGEFPGLVRVVHQENSGGPAAPRNAGLDLARGRFVFFLDADDHLGPEALERMVAMAEENGTDIVLGKMIGVGGRGLPMSMFGRDQPKTDVFSSRVYWALNPLKLFRRDLLERHGLRFPTGMPVGEDQPFVARAYLHASGVSVIAGYDCLYCTLRDDGGNITVRTKGSEPRLRFLSGMVDLLLENVPAGAGRDHLAHRHLTVDVAHLLDSHLVHEPRVQQEKSLAELAEIVAPLWHEGMNDRLSAMARLRLHLVQNRMLDEVLELVRFEQELSGDKAATPVLVDGGRAYARYPFLRDPARGVPDACYDVTRQLGVRHHVSRAELRDGTLHLAGHAYLHRVETTDVSTHLVLRERDSGREFRLPVAHTATPGLGADADAGRYAYELAGFEARVDIATAAGGQPLGDGLWDLSLAVGAQGVTREVRVGSKRAADVSGKASTRVVGTGEDDRAGAAPGMRALTLYTTNPHGNFTLDIGEKKHDVLSRLRLDGVRWAPGAPTELEFTGRCTLAAHPEGALRAVLDDGRGTTVSFEAGRPAADGTFTVRVPVTQLPAGEWTGRLRLGPWSSPLPAFPRKSVPAKWRRRGLPWYAKAVPGAADFALQVAKTNLARAVVARMKP
ncbi:glycosyltransferase family 2 protein [Streptomyces sp. NBC_01176]|uniref:glycosyltransferase family 2 protein n=1 Tax=Streptomyces sp. NBC_01176 TaxID=2903760 RepID=UPI00386ECC5B|nr:glycosyltransferase [Streptomyces sp. NBC_01176]